MLILLVSSSTLFDNYVCFLELFVDINTNQIHSYCVHIVEKRKRRNSFIYNNANILHRAPGVYVDTCMCLSYSVQLATTVMLNMHVPNCTHSYIHSAITHWSQSSVTSDSRLNYDSTFISVTSDSRLKYDSTFISVTSDSCLNYDSTFY